MRRPARIDAPERSVSLPIPGHVAITGILCGSRLLLSAAISGASGSCYTAIHTEYLPGDKRRRIRKQEGDGGCNLARPSEPAQGYGIEKPLSTFRIVARNFRHRGHNRAGRDRIDANLLPRKF